jgi:hypothetical protein
VFKKEVLRRIFGPKRKKVTGRWRFLDLQMRTFVIVTIPQVLLGKSNEEGWNGREM